MFILTASSPKTQQMIFFLFPQIYNPVRTRETTGHKFDCGNT